MDEKIKDLFEEGTEEKETKENGNSIVVASVNELRRANHSNAKIFTTLNLVDNQKELFNIENKSADFKLNDCKNQAIRVKDVYIKSIETMLDEPEVDENGVVIRDREFKKICLLIDDAGKSYVTASKTFTNQMLRYIEMFGIDSIKQGVEIKVCEKAVKGSNNKALGFELL